MPIASGNDRTAAKTVGRSADMHSWRADNWGVSRRWDLNVSSTAPMRSVYSKPPPAARYQLGTRSTAAFIAIRSFIFSGSSVAYNIDLPTWSSSSKSRARRLGFEHLHHLITEVIDDLHRDPAR